jgi:hypothetical protein
VVRRDKGQWSGNHFVVVSPAEPALEDVECQVEANRIGAEEVRVRQLRIFLPGVFELDRLESQTGPALLKALPDPVQTFIDSKTGDEQLDGHCIIPLEILRTRSSRKRIAAGYDPTVIMAHCRVRCIPSPIRCSADSLQQLRREQPEKTLAACDQRNQSRAPHRSAALVYNRPGR